MRGGEEERPAAHDEHARGDVGGLGRARPPSEVRHGDDRQEGAEVVGALYMDDHPSRTSAKFIQRPPSSQSRGLRVNDFDSSHGCLAAPVVSYCPCRLSELQQTVITKHSD